MEIKLYSGSINDTDKIAKIISKYVFKGMVITLDGDLGAGKTTFTKSFGKYINIKDDINSPTFNILKCYFSKPYSLYHIDAYRLEDVNQNNMNIGLEEVIEGDGISIIEWSKFVDSFIPSNALRIYIKIVFNDKREFIIKSSNLKYEDLFKDLEENI